MKTIALILFALSLAISAAAGAAPLAAGKQRFLGSAHGPSQAQDFTRYAVAQRYPDIGLLEVANATLPGHNQPGDRIKRQRQRSAKEGADLIRDDGSERPALAWLRGYVASKP
jgi:hypothetical protein